VDNVDTTTIAGRLRMTAEYGPGKCTPDDLRAAADRLQTLSDELARLRGGVKAWERG
jgi:hypothetical protein